MVYKDYELSPSNRVFEQRNKHSAYSQRLKVVSGSNFVTNGMFSFVLLGTFGYFAKKFYVPNNYLMNIFSLASAGIISFSLAKKYELYTLLFIGDVNEYNYLNESRIQQLFKSVENDESRKTFAIYA